MRQLLIRLFFALIASLTLVIVTYPMTHKLNNGFISSSLALLPPMNAEAPKVRVASGLTGPGVFSVQTPESFVSAQNLSAFYYNYSTASLDVEPWLMPFTHWLRENDTSIYADPALFYWQPAVNNYKQLIRYQQGSAIFDAAMNTLSIPKESSIGTLQWGFQKVPVDGFGGLYLNWQAVPDPLFAESGDFEATLISADTPMSRQFIKEQAALLQELWVSTPLWSFLVAVLFAIAPWLVLPYTRFPIIIAMLIVVVDVASALAMLALQSVWIPIWLPIIMAIVAACWYKNTLGLNRKINLIEKAHQLVAGYWVKYLLDESKPESAYRFLVEQKSTLAFAPLWLDVASGYQRNRQLDKAKMCYEELLAFDPSCAEAKKGLKQLSDVIDGTKTMAVGQTNSELPVGHIKNLSLGRYKISREIGRGAMGIVYEAVDPKINRNVALKVVHLKSLGFDEVDSVKERFFREAQAAGKLNHPNIVTVYDVGEEHDVAFIAMDLLVGDPLSAYINKSTAIDVIERVRWIAQAADALSYAHEHEVIHRDIKPANMIIDKKTMQLKITDFGVARIAGAQQTQTGVVLGSPSYMSPEQIRGDKLSGQTDVFSLGVSLYQALTHKLPFSGDTLPTLAYAITQNKPASPRSLNDDVPVSLVRIVNKALQKELADRYQNAAEFSQALKKWLADHAK